MKEKKKTNSQPPFRTKKDQQLKPIGQFVWRKVETDPTKNLRTRHVCIELQFI